MLPPVASKSAHPLCPCEHYHQLNTPLLFWQANNDIPFSSLIANEAHIFLFMSILTDKRCYLIVVLICISPMASGFEHLFMNLLAFYTSSLRNVYSDSLPIS